MLKKIAFTLCPAIVGSLLFFTAPASAHVTVKPAESATGSWETYTMKVPSEKNQPTTKIVLKMPKDVEFQQYEPIPGWKVSTQKHDDKSVSVTWEATGGGIQEGQFQQFTFVAKNLIKRRKPLGTHTSITKTAALSSGQVTRMRIRLMPSQKLPHPKK